MGVYGVVGSIVGLFTVFTGGVTNAIQRYITFELGRRQGDIRRVFSTAVNVMLLLSGLMIVLLEIGGVYVLTHHLKIPAQSLHAAHYVYQISILTCVLSMVSVPYNALVTAHERMDVFASISILQVVLGCLGAYALSWIGEGGRLLMYAIISAAISVLVQALYYLYCRRTYPEARYTFLLDRSLLREIARYAGVSTGSGILGVIACQGIVFVINWTFGVAINAVYNIAQQLKNSVLSFAFNLQKAVTPQITKTYASGDLELHTKLVYSSCKFEFFLILFLLIPFFLRADYIMHLWLDDVPAYAVSFARCTIFISLTYATLSPIQTAVLASGRIAKFLLIPDSFYLLVLPVGYLACRWYPDPTLLIFIIVALDILACGLRALIAARVTVLSLRAMVVKIFLPCCLVALLSAAVCYGLTLLTSATLPGLLVLLALNSLALVGIIYLVGLTAPERAMMWNMWRTVQGKMQARRQQ
jgi:O-antigen/teichoic acid export membrane protein